MLSLNGVEPSARPGWWQAYDKSRPQIQQRMKKLSELRAVRPGKAQAAIDAAAAKAGLPVAELFYLPLTGQKKPRWVDRPARSRGRHRRIRAGRRLLTTSAANKSNRTTTSRNV
jgi:hypothetical protein